MGDEAKRKQKVFLRVLTTCSRCSIKVCVTEEATIKIGTTTHTLTQRTKKLKHVNLLSSTLPIVPKNHQVLKSHSFKVLKF